MVDERPGIISLKCGALHTGDEFYFHRTRGRPRTGWLRARSADWQGRWVNGVDAEGRLRTIEPQYITRIRPPGRAPL